MSKIFFTFKIMVSALIALLLSSQLGAQNTLYNNSFSSAASVNDWSLSGVSWSALNNGQLIFATVNSYAIMPVLPVGARNMQIDISAVYGDYIYLHTSSDGHTYANQGLFKGGNRLEKASKAIPDGTRYIRLVAAKGTINDVFLLSTTITGSISTPNDIKSIVATIGSIFELAPIKALAENVQSNNLVQSNIATAGQQLQHAASEVQQLVDLLNMPSQQAGRSIAQALGIDAGVAMNNVEEWIGKVVETTTGNDIYQIISANLNRDNTPAPLAQDKGLIPCLILTGNLPTAIFKGAGCYKQGTKIEVSVTDPSNKYDFSGWFEGDKLINEKETFEYIMKEQDVHLRAMFKNRPTPPAAIIDEQ